MCEARRAEYVRLLDEEGMNFTQAAHAVGVSKRTGKAWRNGRTRATGRNEKPLVDWYRSTMDKPKTLHPRYLSQEERIQIADRLRLGDSIRAIARLLGRDPGTVSREVERNRNPESGGYEPYRAQQKAADRLKRPKPRKAAEGTRLWDEIAAGLRRHWSPEQIANRLRLDFPDNGDMHASVETIYQAIYLQARGELKQELKRAMRQGRTARRPQGGQGRKPRFREPMAMISERPPEIEDRAVPGHWEGDLITGSRNKSAIGTLVERTTRFTILLHLPDGHDAEHVQQAIIDKGITPDVTAGLSLGEYGALIASGAMTMADAFAVVRKRGIYMQEAVPTGGAMTAVLGLDPQVIEDICKKTADETNSVVSVANYNCPGQIVITGEKAAVDVAAAACSEAGAKRCVPLKVSGPFHSAMLKGAGEKLAEALESVEIHDIKVPYITNVTADYVKSPAEVKDYLTQQVSSSVRWQQTIERLIADGADEFVEIGPGRSLSGFMRKINRDVKVVNIDKLEDFEKYVNR